MDYPYYHLGQFYMRQKNSEEAKKYYQLALQRNPRYADVYSDLFQIAIEQQKSDEAFSLLKQAYKNGVEDVDLLLYFSIFSRNDNKWQDALSAIDAAIVLNPADLRLLVEKTNIICNPSSS